MISRKSELKGQKDKIEHINVRNAISCITTNVKIKFLGKFFRMKKPRKYIH